MTIEQKAKAYDESLERAKKWYYAPNADKIPTYANVILADVFSELKTDENEKIKESIKKVLANTDFKKLGIEYSFYDMVNWLEKQGGVKKSTTRDEISKYLKNLIFDQSHRGTPMLNYDGRIEEEVDFIINVAKRELKLEKQGEQKPTKNIVETWKDMRLEVYQQASGNRHEPNCSDDTTKMFSLNDIDEIVEKMSEQKPADKEYTFKSIPRLLDMIEPSEKAKFYCQKLIDTLIKEGYNTDAKIVSECLKGMNGEKVAMATMDEKKQSPKFKVGDWVVINGFILKIIEVHNDLYETTFLRNGELRIYDVNILDNNAHLWTIQDAKPGDILASSKSIFIFKGIYMADKPEAYCAVMKDSFNSFIECSEGCWTNEQCYPATKEQQRLLFEKMTEAGYKWEKEVLNKIKMQDLVTSETNVTKISDQDSKWNEDDSWMFNVCCNAIDSYKEPVDKIMVKNWLNYIKTEFTHLQVSKKSDQDGWNEEDEKKRKLLISILKVSHPNGQFKVNPANTTDMEAISTEELVAWLEYRIQPQLKQEELTKKSDKGDQNRWNNEDIRMLNTVINIFEKVYPSNYFTTFTTGSENPTLINSPEIVKWLKSIKQKALGKLKLTKEDLEALRIAIINLGDMAEVDAINNFNMTFGEAKEKLIEIKDRYAE